MINRIYTYFFFFSLDPPTTHSYTLSLHDALPISTGSARPAAGGSSFPSGRSCAQPFVSLPRLHSAAGRENGGGSTFAAARSFSCALRGAARAGGLFSLADRRTVSSAHRDNFAWNGYHAAGAGSRLSHRYRACPRAFGCRDGSFRKSSDSNTGNLSFETTD